MHNTAMIATMSAIIQNTVLSLKLPKLNESSHEDSPSRSNAKLLLATTSLFDLTFITADLLPVSPSLASNKTKTVLVCPSFNVNVLGLTGFAQSASTSTVYVDLSPALFVIFNGMLNEFPLITISCSFMSKLAELPVAGVSVCPPHSTTKSENSLYLLSPSSNSA